MSSDLISILVKQGNTIKRVTVSINDKISTLSNSFKGIDTYFHSGFEIPSNGSFKGLHIEPGDYIYVFGEKDLERIIPTYKSAPSIKLTPLSVPENKIMRKNIDLRLPQYHDSLSPPRIQYKDMERKRAVSIC